MNTVKEESGGSFNQCQNLSLAKVNFQKQHQQTIKMIPPIDDTVLSSNPKFAALHTTLTTTILNPSGSTKKHPAQKERDAVSEVLIPFS
jgi:hypothetical protein